MRCTDNMYVLRDSVNGLSRHDFDLFGLRICKSIIILTILFFVEVYGIDIGVESSELMVTVRDE